MRFFGARAHEFRERASTLEELGFGSFSVGDHLGHVPPLTACAVIAQATQTARLGPLVLNNDFRHPAVLAREAVALADLSGGRFDLGLGAGYARREYVRAGIAYEPAATRIARLEEATQILSRLFAGEQVTFNGHYYRVQEDSLQGLQHRVPVLIGGQQPGRPCRCSPLRRHPQLRWPQPIRGGTVEDMSDFSSGALNRQVHALSAVGREVGGDLERHVLVQWHEVTNDRPGAAERAAKRLEIPAEIALDSPYVLIGTAEEIAAQVRSHHQTFGITRWTVFADHPELQPAEALAPVISALTS